MPCGHVALNLKRSEHFSLQAEFDLPERGITVLFGQSGCGKTTLLRCVAGLTRAHGMVRVGSALWQDDATGVFLPTYRRRIGYVFQEASLFPHLSARCNIEFARKRAKTPASDDRLLGLIRLLGIEDLLDKEPENLSGGERQRVAIVRALAVTPDILLMDEPLSALDNARKEEFLPWLERLRDESNIPILYVTHSSAEMRRLADQLLLLEQGKMLDVGNPSEVLYRQGLRDENAHVEAVLEGRVTSFDDRWQMCEVAVDSLKLEVPAPIAQVGAMVRLSIGARDVSVARARASETSIRNIFPVEIRAIDDIPNRAQVLLSLKIEGGPVIYAQISARASSELALVRGERVFAQLKAVSLSG